MLVLLEKQMNNCNKKFIDKAETRKTFKMFEKQLKNMLDIVVSKYDEDDLTDAMIAKKSINGVGYSCVSC